LVNIVINIIQRGKEKAMSKLWKVTEQSLSFTQRMRPCSNPQFPHHGYIRSEIRKGGKIKNKGLKQATIKNVIKGGKSSARKSGEGPG